MTILNALAKTVVSQMVAVLSRTASAASAAFDLQLYEGVQAFILSAGAATAGTLPTLDLKITECDTSDGTFTDVASGAFTQITDTAGVQKLSIDVKSLKRYVKADWTIGGTSNPAFPFGVAHEGLTKY